MAWGSRFFVLCRPIQDVSKIEVDMMIFSNTQSMQTKEQLAALANCHLSASKVSCALLLLEQFSHICS